LSASRIGIAGPRLQAATARGLTRFVGRSNEIEQLEQQHEEDTETLEALDRESSDVATHIEQLHAGVDDTELRRVENERSRLTERLQGIDHQIQGYREQRERLERSVARADAERESARESIQQHETALVDLKQQVESTQRELTTISDQTEPIAEQRASLQRRLEEEQGRLRQLQNKQRDLERTRDSQRFDVERETSQGEHLVERVTDILEIEDPVPQLEQQPAEDDLDLQKLETALHRLRQRSRRIGAFGEDNRHFVAGALEYRDYEQSFADSEALEETPRRVADAYSELLTPRPFRTTTFPNDGGYDELIVARSIPFHSLCMHHLLPFHGVAHIGYLPDRRIIGLSKLGRVVERLSDESLSRHERGKTLETLAGMIYTRLGLREPARADRPARAGRVAAAGASSLPNQFRNKDVSAHRAVALEARSAQERRSLTNRAVLKRPPGKKAWPTPRSSISPIQRST
jgi:predicted nuclease with TOPRIM domain